MIMAWTSVSGMWKSMISSSAALWHSKFFLSVKVAEHAVQQQLGSLSVFPSGGELGLQRDKNLVKTWSFLLGSVSQHCLCARLSGLSNLLWFVAILWYDFLGGPYVWNILVQQPNLACVHESIGVFFLFKKRYIFRSKQNSQEILPSCI